MSCPCTGIPTSRPATWSVAGCVLTIGEETYDTEPGASWCIAPDVVHGAEVLEDAVAIEVFAPPREDYIPDTSNVAE